MSEIYITGHRNPDTDSIVASMAYAHLRNAMGDRDYKAVRIGGINDETQRLLDFFGVEPPPLVKNMRTQVRDLDYDRTPALDCSVSMSLALETMRAGSLNALPIVDDEGQLYGMLSSGDIASYDMQSVIENRLDDLPLFNLLSVLEGTLVNEYLTERNSVSGDLFIALPQSYEDPALSNPDSILIFGDQPEMVDQAIARHVNCLILCRAAAGTTRRGGPAGRISAPSGRRPPRASSSPPRCRPGAPPASSIRPCPSTASAKGRRSPPST